MFDDLLHLFTSSSVAPIAWSVVCAAIAAGAVSPLMVVHRMAFFSDALSHSILLGVPLALLTGIAEPTGMLSVALITGLGIVALKRRTALPTDSILGVLMAGAFALAVIAYQKVPTARDLHSYLFGDIGMLPSAWLPPMATVSAVVFLYSLMSYNRLSMTALARDLAQARGVRVTTHDILLVIVTAVVITFGVRVMGVLMISALLVMPAATARNVTRSLGAFFWVSIATSLFASVTGFALCYQLKYEPGASIVVMLLLCFLGSLAVGKILAGIRAASLE